jgi:hypothetical protein
MKTYRIVIESLFLRRPGHPGVFSATSAYIVHARGAPHAAARAAVVAREQFAGAGVTGRTWGPAKVLHRVEQVLELREDEDTPETPEGASYQAMGFATKVRAMVRAAWIRRFRAYEVV